MSSQPAREGVALCPWCNAPVYEMIADLGNRKWFWIECENSSCHVQPNSLAAWRQVTSIEQAIKNWNKRSIIKDFETTKIAPCPYCGYEAHIATSGGDWLPITFYIQCTSYFFCSVQPQAHTWPRPSTMEQAIKNWNTRA